MAFRNMLRSRELNGRVNFVTRTPRTPFAVIDGVAESGAPLMAARTAPSHLRLGIYVFVGEALAALLSGKTSGFRKLCVRIDFPACATSAPLAASDNAVESCLPFVAFCTTKAVQVIYTQVVR